MPRKIVHRRRKLLPWWMTFFIWIFMLLGGLGIVMNVMEIMGAPIGFWIISESSIYGMETYDRFSFLGIFISLIIIFKGVTGFAMWTEKKIAIGFGLIDAAVGIIVCIVMMIIHPIFELVDDGTWTSNLRLELLFLIPYLIKCWKIRKPWRELSEPISAETNPSAQAKKEMTPPTVSKPDVQPSINKEVKEEVSDETESETMDKEDPRRFMPK